MKPYPEVEAAYLAKSGYRAFDGATDASLAEDFCWHLDAKWRSLMSALHRTLDMYDHVTSLHRLSSLEDREELFAAFDGTLKACVELNDLYQPGNLSRFLNLPKKASKELAKFAKDRRKSAAELHNKLKHETRRVIVASCLSPADGEFFSGYRVYTVKNGELMFDSQFHGRNSYGIGFIPHLEKVLHDVVKMDDKVSDVLQLSGLVVPDAEKLDIVIANPSLLQRLEAYPKITFVGDSGLTPVIRHRDGEMRREMVNYRAPSSRYEINMKAGRVRAGQKIQFSPPQMDMDERPKDVLFTRLGDGCADFAPDVGE